METSVRCIGAVLNSVVEIHKVDLLATMVGVFIQRHLLLRVGVCIFTNYSDHIPWNWLASVDKEIIDYIRSIKCMVTTDITHTNF